MTIDVENYPIINVPFLYKYGMRIVNSTVSPATKLSILAGTCRDELDIIDIRLGDFNPDIQGNITTAPVRIDNTINGVGGLDEGTVAANTMYAIYIIADSRGYKPISAVATGGLNIYANGPLMPVGYDSKRLIGFWATDNSANWFTGYYSGLGIDLTFIYDTPQETSVTAGTSNIYANVSLFDLVPVIDNIPVSIFTVFSPGAAGDTLSLLCGRSVSSLGQAVITGQVANVNVTTTSSVFVRVILNNMLPPPFIQYKVSGTDTVAIYVAGFSFSLLI